MQENIGTAVDDSRHSELVHLAKVVSFRDLREEILSIQQILQFQVMLAVFSSLCNISYIFMLGKNDHFFHKQSF